MAKPKPEKQIILVAGGKQLTRKQWRRFEQVGLRPELDLDELWLNWSDRKVKDLEAKGMVTGITIEATLEAAPNVTVTVRDPDGLLFRRRPGRVEKRKRRRGAGPVQVDEGWDPILPPDVLGRPMQISLDGVTYQLVKATYQHGSGELALTFEHELIYLLKRHKGAKHAPRERVTRAQFILALVRELEPEVRQRRYRFVCPELNVRQPIDQGQRRATPTPTTGTSSGGPTGRNIDRRFPKHPTGTPGFQLTEDEARACLAAGGFWGQELDAGVQVMRGESTRMPGIYNSSAPVGQGAIGLLQLLPASWGAEGQQWLKEAGGYDNLTNPIANCKLARRLYESAGKSWRTHWVGTQYLTVGDGPGNGRPSRAECRELAATVTDGGSPEGPANSRTVTETRSYQFKRERKESSWAAITRLAGEVKWRAFVVGNSLYYMSEEQLYGRRARYEVGPDHDAVLDLSYDVDWGKTVSEASLQVTLARWGASPGSVILLDGFGAPDGRWLVAGVSRDYFQPTAEVKLLQPAKALLEPPNETRERTVRDPGQSDPGGGDGPEPARKFYNRAVEISKKNYPYAWGGGHTSTGAPTASHRGEGTGYDCSGYIGACLIAAGIRYSGESSGYFGGLPGAKPGRGKFITVHYSSGHVYASFEEPLGVPHQRADTSAYGGGASGPHVRDSPRSYPGYSQCHFDWPGD